MPHINFPRRGTMQFHPRKRAKRAYARVRYWPALSNNAVPLGFAGYKVGMTHLIITDNKSTSMTKGEEICMPATIIECPPLKTASIVFYKKDAYGSKVASAVMANNLSKELARKISVPKNIKKKLEDFNPKEYSDIRVLVYTQPKITTIGKKKPELFELKIGGKVEEKYKWAKENLGKEINVKDVIVPGEQIVIHAITKGKGIQGATKRFGTTLRAHKSEKGVRGPANVGSWGSNRSWAVAHPGQTGYHQRTEENKWVLKIGDNPEDINKKSGYKFYGVVKNNYVLVKGSIPGAPKRLIIMTHAIRPDSHVSKDAPAIEYVSRV